MDSDKTQIVVRQIPADLWKRFKVHTVQNDLTIQVAIAQAIEQYLQKSA